MKRGSLSRHNPEKVAKLLYLYSIGTSQTRLVRKYGYERNTVVSVLADYADHLGKFRELSGKVAAKNYLSMSRLEEDLIQQVRDPPLDYSYSNSSSRQPSPKVRETYQDNPHSQLIYLPLYSSHNHTS